ncbi:hypothetical protein A946_00580 [Methylacidiphilum kamchatkense Kam1]|uniref:Uncharacterized protein n=1 Tax=Methylacidiphilum kamchatkense Kam1 TaxID=1202785 RepID=A0ABR4ZZY9_9BACT|nr:hypothetical protein A946_00580 [Methylacidiphilum kamchatkense Kam1]
MTSPPGNVGAAAERGSAVVGKVRPVRHEGAQSKTHRSRKQTVRTIANVFNSRNTQKSYKKKSKGISQRRKKEVSPKKSGTPLRILPA